MLELFQYDFMQRALISGLLVGVICPAIGVFLIMRRQSLIGDGLGHIAFAGVATGWLLGIYPVYSATAFTVIAALGIEELRARRPAFKTPSPWIPWPWPTPPTRASPRQWRPRKRP